MIVLAIDTSANLCAACLFDTETDRLLAARSDDIGRGHAEHLMDLIAGVVADAGSSFEAIGKIGVTVGPGSFTGIRVGVAAARGFGVARETPVFGVTTLEAIAHDALSSERTDEGFAVAIQAGRGMVSAQIFDASGHPLDGPFQAAPDMVAVRLARAKLIAGDAAEEIATANDARHVLPVATGSIETIARLAALSQRPPVPLYLRGADAKPQDGFRLPHAATGAAR